MPKLKPLKKDEDMQKIPVAEPILIELGPPAEAAAHEVEAPDSKPETVVDEPASDEVSPEVKSLKEQITALQEAEKARAADLARAEKDRADAIRFAQERERERQTMQTERDQSERDLVNGALQSAQVERDAAKREYSAAYAAGDSDALADAGSKVARAESKILSMESAIAHMSVTKTEPQREEPRQAPQPTQRQLTPEEYVDQNTALLPAERTWLKSHLDLVTDQNAMNELGVAHSRALKAGHRRGTTEYFNYLDEFMGYQKPNNQRQNEHHGDDGDERTSIMSAPVTRNAPNNGNQQSNQVYLDADQRALARSMGISDREMALQVQRLDRAKRDDPERYPSRR